MSKHRFWYSKPGNCKIQLLYREDTTTRVFIFTDLDYGWMPSNVLLTEDECEMYADAHDLIPADDMTSTQIAALKSVRKCCDYYMIKKGA